MRRRVIWSGAIGALLFGVLVVVGALVIRDYRAAGPLDQPKTVVVPHGIGLQATAALLGDAGTLRHPLVFVLGARFIGKAGQLKAGEYAIPARLSVAGLIDLLASGKTVVHRLVVPEGLTVEETLALVAGAEAMTGEVTDRPPEGGILPETYFYSYGERRQDMVDRMHQAMGRLVNELWAARPPELPLQTPEEAVTLASIVEKETAIDAERPRIAAVFYNRLRLGMRLQADPTVAYGITEGAKPLDHPLSHAELDTPSPYNTYLVKGLPPGPIDNPGRAALRAVLRPVTTDELYFVADGKGGHAFAATLADHNRNVARWRQKPTAAQ
ncbi:MAG TPA: endolytic transglycosylase MltG [Stellaceae bacterium]|nr:endolytic transglycosylase MltG [Stellaceae bacterium]